MVLANISCTVISWKSHPNQREHPTVSAVEKAVNVTAPLDTVMKDEEWNVLVLWGLPSGVMAADYWREKFSFLMRQETP